MTGDQPAEVLGANSTRGWRWQRYHLWAKRWKQAGVRMGDAIRKKYRTPFPACTVHMVFEMSRGVRRDPHNYMSTVCKHILDGLVVSGVWPDDNPKYITMTEPQFVSVGKKTIYKYHVVIEKRT